MILSVVIANIEYHGGVKGLFVNQYEKEEDGKMKE